MSIKFEHTEVMGWEAAIRGMRNPMNSWDQSDTCFSDIPCYTCENKIEGTAHCDMKKHGGGHRIGLNDLALMKKLVKAGTDHRKFMRMITVYVDITAPLYWWKEFDTYKIGTVANSCSTMHKIAAKEFTLEDFSCEHLFQSSFSTLDETIDELNYWRNIYVNYEKYKRKELPMNEEFLRLIDGIKDKKDIWWQMIQLLPTSYNQKRTVMLNYEVLANIYKSRRGHKLDEWSIGFMQWIESLPYAELITGKWEE